MLASAHADTSQEAAFLAENQAAMDKMIARMDIKPTYDVNYDFISMMVPHHQGAIDMSEAELSYGRNEQLRRIAQEIVVVVAMRAALGEKLTPSLNKFSPLDKG